MLFGAAKAADGSFGEISSSVPIPANCSPSSPIAADTSVPLMVTIGDMGKSAASLGLLDISI